MIVQMLNLDIDADQDEIHPAQGFTVSVPLPAGTKGIAGDAVLCSPDGDQAAVKVKASVRGQVVDLPPLAVPPAMSDSARFPPRATGGA
jgi:hypothetical protein